MSKHLMKIAVSAMALIAALGIASIPNRNVSADQDTAITPGKSVSVDLNEDRTWWLKFTPSKNKFSDVKKSDYFYKATLWASEKKILAGYSDGTFRPNGDCLRRQMVTFLYKYEKFVSKKG